MNIYNHTDFEYNLYFNGDIHGDFDGLYHVVNINHLEDSIVVLLGDCGFGFNRPAYYDEVMEKLNAVCEKKNTRIFMLRGNHDNPEYFDGEKINYSHVKAVPDYSVILTTSGNVLCIGGAISVDRTWRLNEEVRMNKFRRNSSYKKQLYWQNEAPILKEGFMDELQHNNIEINIVASHTRPTLHYNLEISHTNNWGLVDSTLKNDVENEHNVLNEVLKQLLAKENHPTLFWYHGHYHWHNIEYNEDVDVHFFSLENSFNPYSHTDFIQTGYEEKDIYEWLAEDDIDLDSSEIP